MRKFIAGLGTALMLFTVPMTALAAFSDVDSDDFYYDAISFLEDKGIVVGYSDGTFGYDLNINRAEFMKLVMEAMTYGKESMGVAVFFDQSCFNDVPANEWYTAYVCYAKDQEWIVGYEDGTFRPSQNISFVEGMKIVMEVFEVSYVEATPWYKDIVDEASEMNIIPLTIDGFNQLLSRAEMSDMVTRVIKMNLGELNTYLGEYADVRATYETIEAGITSELTMGCTGGPGCVELQDDFYLWSYNNEAQIVGYDVNGEVMPVGDGFYTVAQSDAGWFGDVSSPGMLKIFNGDLYFGTYGWTSDPDSGTSTLSSVYKYDENMDVAESVYTYEASGNAADEVPYLRFVAYSPIDNQLIFLMFPGVDFSPGGCPNWDWEPTVENYWNWLFDASMYYAVDLDDPSMELLSYDVPQWKVDEAQAEMDACVDSF